MMKLEDGKNKHMDLSLFYDASLSRRNCENEYPVCDVSKSPLPFYFMLSVRKIGSLRQGLSQKRMSHVISSKSAAEDDSRNEKFENQLLEEILTSILNTDEMEVRPYK